MSDDAKLMYIDGEWIVPEIIVHPEVKNDKKGFKALLYPKAKRILKNVTEEDYLIFKKTIGDKVNYKIKIKIKIKF